MFLSHFKSIFEHLVAYTGTDVECPCCNRQAKRFFPAGVVTKRAYARCVFCGSLERHRLIALMLKRFPFNENAKVLCIAPEEPLTQCLKSLFSAQITTLDLLRNDVDVKGDVCALPFDSNSFDVVIANHVLEHVADDSKAMRELQRILKLGGKAILQTPVHWDLEKTEEDPTASPAECLRRFGQDDHVRLYGRDFVDRLKNINWKVELLPVIEQFGTADISKYGLENDEVFFKIKVPS